MTTVQEPTIKDVYQLTLSLVRSVEVLTKKVIQLEERVDQLEKRMDRLEARMDKLEQRVDELYDILHRFASDTEKRFIALEKRMALIEKTMVTKDYFDHRLGIPVGKLNRKTEALTEQLVSEQSLSRAAADRVLAMPPSLESLS